MTKPYYPISHIIDQYGLPSPYIVKSVAKEFGIKLARTKSNTLMVRHNDVSMLVRSWKAKQKIKKLKTDSAKRKSEYAKQKKEAIIFYQEKLNKVLMEKQEIINAINVDMRNVDKQRKKQIEKIFLAVREGAYDPPV